MFPMVTCPPKLIHWSAFFQHHFVLGHLVAPKYRQYTETIKYFAERGDWVTVDNGVTETGTAMSMPRLLHVARTVGAREVVLPDVFDDLQGTDQAVDEAYAFYKQIEVTALDKSKPYLGLYLMAVVHGHTLDEVKETTLHYATEHPRITTIGIPKVLTRNLHEEGGRPAVLQWLKENDLRMRFDIHLLGVWEDMHEILKIAQAPYGDIVRSIDTSWPIMAATNYMDMRDYLRTKTDWLESAVINLPHIAIQNLLTYAKWAQGDADEEDTQEKDDSTLRTSVASR